MDTSSAVENMTLGDLEWFEETTNMPFSSLSEDAVTAKQMSALTAVMIARRDGIDRETALAAARDMKLVDATDLL
jgi:hypothetical protein|nr:MAG TPA: hypothetical protein [Siphoviridae sp. ctkEu9]